MDTISAQTKVCRKCGVERSVTEFRKLPKARDGLYGQCKPCAAAYRREHYLANIERYRAWDAAHRAKNPELYPVRPAAPRVSSVDSSRRRYGIRPGQFEEMIAEQSGKCAICHVELVRPHVDHDHVTGRIRGILCHLCNPGLGMFRDNPEFLRKAIEYLAER